MGGQTGADVERVKMVEKVMMIFIISLLHITLLMSELIRYMLLLELLFVGTASCSC